MLKDQTVLHVLKCRANSLQEEMDSVKADRQQAKQDICAAGNTGFKNLEIAYLFQQNNRGHCTRRALRGPSVAGVYLSLAKDSGS